MPSRFLTTNPKHSDYWHMNWVLGRGCDRLVFDDMAGKSPGAIAWSIVSALQRYLNQRNAQREILDRVWVDID